MANHIVIDSMGPSTLQTAAAGGHAETVNVLLSRPDVNINNADLDCTAREIAVCHEHKGVVDVLLADDRVRFPYPTLLRIALDYNDLNLVKRVLAVPRTSKRPYLSLLYQEAVNSDEVEVVSRLLEIQDLAIETMKYLIGKNLYDPNMVNAMGRTAMTYAASETTPFEDMRQEIVSKFEPNIYRWRKLGPASSDERAYVIELVLATRRFDANTQDEDGMTVLHHAVESGNLETVRAFSTNGTNTTLKNNNSETVMDTAVRKNDAKKVAILENLIPAR
ncbi:hypothetical protein PT974_01230 [Cladobotryum mycophilum]|uniref:Ankyrin n=1 Tax=Cladobotryum mycophilum TaxID=491253 RepID=A0ABR0T341_9HYPO